MIFNIFAIKLENFKVYKGTHFFEFPQTPGIYYFTGKNLRNKRLGANGVGKSSFMDAMEWCLYGKTSRGLKASDVVTHGEKSCSVTLTMIISDEETEIKRTQNPNKIFKDNKPISQEDLNLFLRINQDAFRYSIVVPQFGDSFFDLGPTQKLTVFSQIMDLEFWLEKSREAFGKTESLKRDLNKVELKVENNEGKLETNRKYILDYRSMSKEFIVEKKESLAVIEKNIRNIQKKKLTKEKDIKDLLAALPKLQEKYDLWTKRRNINKNKIEEKQELIRNHKSDMRIARGTIENSKNELKRVSSLKGEICKHCRQLVTDKHVATEKEFFTARIKKFEADLEKHTTKMQKTQAMLSKVEDKNTKLEITLNKIQSDLNETKDLIRELKQEIKIQDSLIENNRGLKKKAKEKKNPYINKIKDAKNEINSLKFKLKKFKKETNDIRINIEATEYWVQGFKRIRLYVIQEALSSLELEVNNQVSRLGLAGWNITFDIERENKAGGVSKGFSVFIHQPDKEEPVRWESFSGGETQRLAMAGNMGLSNLILQQVGLSSEIEFIDEPSRHLSPEGVEDMIETLHSRAKSSNKKIWLVEHNAPNYGDFENIITVKLSKEGIPSLTYK